jgi:segregation and condensation protein A
MIEREEMDITEINLGKIADDYVLYIRQAKEAISPEELADFLVVAAKLLYIKSKALLPYLLIDDEEDDSSDLERQLKMYKEFIEASEKIKGILAQENFLFVPAFNKGRRDTEVVKSFVPPKKISAKILAEKMSELIANLKKQEAEKIPEETLLPKMNIEEKIILIRDLLLKKLKINFSRMLSEAKDKTDVIVSFLAVLELAKQKELAFEQIELFSEIHILTKNNQDDL